jgi:hypothetical protein
LTLGAFPSRDNHRRFADYFLDDIDRLLKVLLLLVTLFHVAVIVNPGLRADFVPVVSRLFEDFG